jgi:hypothetical protein
MTNGSTQPMQPAQPAHPTQPMTGGMGTTTGEGDEEEMPPLPRAFMGDATSLQVFISRVPRLSKATVAAMPAGLTDSPEGSEEVPTDQRLVVYRFEEGKGLIRAEANLAKTRTDGSPTLVEQVLASEVTSLTFSYWDGSAWQTSWDGNETASDSMTPKGPPMAVAIELELTTPGPSGSDPRKKKFRHVVSIPTAAGKPQTGTEESLTPETEIP